MRLTLQTYGSMENWDVSQLTDMTEVFFDYEGPSFNINGWDVSKVATMATMFKSSTFRGDIRGWNVAKLGNANRMVRTVFFLCFKVFSNFVNDTDVFWACARL